jgi:hypothetical protein
MQTLIDQFLADASFRWHDDLTETENLTEWLLQNSTPADWIDAQTAIGRVAK